MNKHTPGPWSIGNANLKEEAEIGVHGPGAYGFIICDLQADGYDEETQKANARLIAAAPELLEALVSLFADYKQLADSGDAGNWKLEDLPVGQQALDAIAKARGEA